MTRGKGKSFLVNIAEENGQISLANEEMRSEKKTESVKYPKMPFSAACSTPGLPQPPRTDRDCSGPPGAANSPSPFPAGQEEICVHV